MRFELTCPKDKRFSRPPRYDRFDNPPYMNCRSADFIGYSIFLEIFLEMLFSVAFGVPKKSVFTRLFRVFATFVLANFQDRLVMTASICLRIFGCGGEIDRANGIIPHNFDFDNTFFENILFFCSYIGAVGNNSV